MISAILFISFFIFLILGVPIGICLGLSSVCAILYSGTSLTIVATNMYSGISKFLLLAIPFFVLSGNIMAKAGISKRLIKFVDTCVGHKKGGIAIVCVIVACFFGAISGSGPATVAALGAVLIPAMVEQGGFSAPFSTALMATSSSIAIVIPPSIAFVVYASITGTSIADMFIPLLPSDGIPYWDFDSPDIPNDLRDASAGAIMASALTELSEYLPEKKIQYRSIAKRQLRTLSSPEYLAAPNTNGNFILKHSVGHKPMKGEVDVPLTYADYYFIEALIRMNNLEKQE